MKESICKFNDSKANAINCTQFIYETSDAQNRPLRASTHHVGLILRGSGTLTVNGVRQPLSVGNVYFIRKGSAFSLVREDDMEYLYVSFHGWHADELMERMGLSKERFVFVGTPAITAFWNACFAESDKGNLDLFSETVLLYTVASLADAEKGEGGLADRIITYANEHYGNARLSLGDVAAALGYDAKYLSAVFKAKTNITFTQYLRTVRVKHAAFLFEEGVESIKNVALLCGFSDALYFSKIFRRETGMTPTEYRKRVRNGE